MVFGGPKVDKTRQCHLRVDTAQPQSISRASTPAAPKTSICKNEDFQFIHRINKLFFGRKSLLKGLFIAVVAPAQ